ncbi:MAG: PhoH family protein [Ignavibacteria bacterium]
MSIVEKKINLPGVDLINFAGINDENLNLIKDSFDATIVFRGDTIFLKGDDSEIKVIEKVFSELIFLQKRQGGIFSKDVKLVLDLIDSKEGQPDKIRERLGISPNEIKDVILFKKNDFIKPRTGNQLEYLKKVKENDIVFAIGPAGTGKTYLAVAFAVAALKNKEVSKIVLTRPAVEAGESLGFLPGDLSAKVDPYLRPLYDALEEMIPMEKLEYYMDKNVIQVIPLAYMRGRTINNAFVILDEAQNSTALQMKMFLTRLGPTSKAVVTGDVTQIDLPKKEQSGLIQVQEILKDVEDIAFLYFEKSDVVRHKLVKDIINAYEKFQG